MVALLDHGRCGKRSSGLRVSACCLGVGRVGLAHGGPSGGISGGISHGFFRYAVKPLALGRTVVGCDAFEAEFVLRLILHWKS